MITKERLEELIEQGATIYLDFLSNFQEIKLDKSNTVSEHFYFDNEYHYNLKKLFETREEAEWVAKMHTSRTEYFKPPLELKDNEKYKFTTAKGGKMSISKFVYRSGEVQWWLSYVGTHRTFYSYQEAVDYARKLFKGEE